MSLILNDLLETANTSMVCCGSGIFGMGYMLCAGSPKDYGRYIGYTAVGAAIIMGIFNKRPYRTVDANHIVVVTGCDSGLGHNMARKCYTLNMFVVAACYNITSDGARKLAEDWDPKRSRIVEVNLRKPETIQQVHQTVTEILQNHPNMCLSAIINNAGVLGFGEFEWQTDEQMCGQIEVNLLGTMRFTKQFLPMCRQYKSRIICVSSHCAIQIYCVFGFPIQALPSLAPYSASKAGLSSFVDSLRVEMRKYGVDVINFTPGSFVMSSNILASQAAFSRQQLDAFTDEQIDFYGEYFQRFQEFMNSLSGKRPVTVYSKRDGLMRTFEAALLDQSPKALYKYEPTLRYQLYQNLLKYSPTDIRDYLVMKFTQMPKYTKTNQM